MPALLILILLLSASGTHAKNADSENQNFVNLITSCSNKIQKDFKKEDIVPIELVLAQSILESNWGKSRFAKKGNNYFGIRTWDPERAQLKPLKRPDADFGLVVYRYPCDSVADYLDNLNTSDKYVIFRKIRQLEIALWGQVDPIRLASGLKQYSEQRAGYVKKIKRKIALIKKKKYTN